MKLFWQPVESDPKDFQQIDSSQWNNLPNVPLLALNGQGNIFDDADHYTVEHLIGVGMRVWSWWDDPTLYDPSEFRARVVTIRDLRPDPLLGGAYNTHQDEVWYSTPDGSVAKRFHRDGPWSSVTLRDWSEFVPPSTKILHGLYIPDAQWVASQQARTMHGWREWDEGVDPKFIHPETGLVHSMGVRGPKQGTITKYLSNDSGSVLEHVLDVERNVIDSTKTASSQSFVIVKTTAGTEDWGWGNFNPGTLTHPNGLYKCQLDCTVNDGDFSYGVKTINSVTGHFCIVDPIATGHDDSWEQTEGTHTGTGVKTCSRTLNPTDSSIAARFQAVMVVDHPSGHGGGNHTFTLELNEADDLIEGPWPSSTPANSEIGGRIAGEDSDQSEVGGRIQGVIADNSEIGGRIEGFVSDNDEIGGRIAGQDSDQSEIGGRIEGTSSDNDEIGGRIEGEASANDEVGGRIQGFESDGSEIGGRIEGTTSDQSEIGGRIAGEDSDQSEIGGRIQGVQADANEIGGRIEGEASDADEIGGRIAGQDSDQSEVGGRIAGQDSDQGEIGGRIAGIDQAENEIGGRITGFESINNEIGGRIQGVEADSSEIGGRIEGQAGGPPPVAKTIQFSLLRSTNSAFAMRRTKQADSDQLRTSSASLSMEQ
jgi:hypothetical protein